jgi:hypothetical protein
LPRKGEGHKNAYKNYAYNNIDKHKESRKGGMVGNFSAVIGKIKRQMRPISHGRPGFMSAFYARPRLVTNPPCFFLHIGNFRVIDLD